MKEDNMRSIRTKEAERMFFESADYENALDNWVEERHCIECGLIFDEELPEHICSDCLEEQKKEDAAEEEARAM